MNIGKTSTTFLGIFLIIGLSGHFGDCLIEHAGYKKTAMMFEMEHLNYFEEKCKTAEKKEEWPKILYVTTSMFPEMESITNTLKLEIECLENLYLDMPANIGIFPILWLIQFLALDYSFVFLQGYYEYMKKQQRMDADQLLRISVYLAAFGADVATAKSIHYEIGPYIYEAMLEERGQDVYSNEAKVLA